MSPVDQSLALVPVATFFPGRSRRWCNDSCRAGRIPGVTKVGGGWFIRACDVERLVSGAAPRVPSVADAEADLRARGVL